MYPGFCVFGVDFKAVYLGKGAVKSHYFVFCVLGGLHSFSGTSSMSAVTGISKAFASLLMVKVEISRQGSR